MVSKAKKILKSKNTGSTKSSSNFNLLFFIIPLLILAVLFVPSPFAISSTGDDERYFDENSVANALFADPVDPFAVQYCS